MLYRGRESYQIWQRQDIRANIRTTVYQLGGQIRRSSSTTPSSSRPRTRSTASKHPPTSTRLRLTFARSSKPSTSVRRALLRVGRLALRSLCPTPLGREVRTRPAQGFGDGQLDVSLIRRGHVAGWRVWSRW